ncbi:MAG TPA: DUF3048 domain-containing protein [Thermoanaerobacterales bacterium]|nr:DUF3048 domain-containing protein [Thermoanaerobacterales bacterium]
MLRSRWLAFVLILLISLLQAGCGKKNLSAPANPPDTGGDSKQIVESSPQETPKAINPLTGLADMNTKYVNQRPLAVMVENEYHARPQSGLDKADVVYEIMAEGGITRFLALFLGRDVDEIGPIRSARPYFIDYAMEYDGIYIHYGASPQGYSDLNKLKIDHIDGIYDGVTFWRDRSRKEPHNAYSSTEKILKTSEKRGFLKPVDLQVWNFNGQDAQPRGEILKKFKLTYFSNYSVSYTYDATKMAYERYINDKPHTDRKTGEPIFVKNIIVQYVDARVIDKAGRLEMRTVGSGKAYYISDGFCEELKWEKESRSARTVYTLADGTELTINPGNTWIQIMPQWGKFEKGEKQ